MAKQPAPSRIALTLLLEAVPHRVERDAETGRYFAINDDLHTVAEGDTQAEAKANFREALVGLVDYCLESGLPLPKALAEHRKVAIAYLGSARKAAGSRPPSDGSTPICFHD